jgi:hypothetical protein
MLVAAVITAVPVALAVRHCQYLPQFPSQTTAPLVAVVVAVVAVVRLNCTTPITAAAAAAAAALASVQVAVQELLHTAHRTQVGQAVTAQSAGLVAVVFGACIRHLTTAALMAVLAAGTALLALLAARPHLGTPLHTRLAAAAAQQVLLSLETQTSLGPPLEPDSDQSAKEQTHEHRLQLRNHRGGLSRKMHGDCLHRPRSPDNAHWRTLAF